MKEEYEDVDDFVSDVMPIEFRKKIHKDTEPEKLGSDSAAYKFEEKLEKILAETEENKSESGQKSGILSEEKKAAGEPGRPVSKKKPKKG